ncbi:hypothetical protein BCV69DRAFT_295754 [Microstroma glucosiphilum]|uniref:Uncharacterized protein n=1 Tax=Pseudomicrostroma glucosiphilum TaxID=1684307 RepID=A0A316TYB9_9BASI|nr:hypothetical protein BCV69DRAFT_295754 [Pseudomicrostroma glucosiphilum]PWN17724.1 hypothetical protein BCV69DRAFT_295754 [Pseudomicrostroma glucosiphilum]
MECPTEYPFFRASDAFIFPRVLLRLQNFKRSGPLDRTRPILSAAGSLLNQDKRYLNPPGGLPPGESGKYQLYWPDLKSGKPPGNGRGYRANLGIAERCKLVRRKTAQEEHGTSAQEPQLDPAAGGSGSATARAGYDIGPCSSTEDRNGNRQREQLPGSRAGRSTDQRHPIASTPPPTTGNLPGQGPSKAFTSLSTLRTISRDQALSRSISVSSDTNSSASTRSPTPAVPSGSTSSSSPEREAIPSAASESSATYPSYLARASALRLCMKRYQDLPKEEKERRPLYNPRSTDKLNPYKHFKPTQYQAALRASHQYMMRHIDALSPGRRLASPSVPPGTVPPSPRPSNSSRRSLASSSAARNARRRQRRAERRNGGSSSSPVVHLSESQPDFELTCNSTTISSSRPSVASTFYEDAFIVPPAFLTAIKRLDARLRHIASDLGCEYEERWPVFVPVCRVEMLMLIQMGQIADAASEVLKFEADGRLHRPLSDLEHDEDEEEDEDDAIVAAGRQRQTSKKRKRPNQAVRRRGGRRPLSDSISGSPVANDDDEDEEYSLADLEMYDSDDPSGGLMDLNEPSLPSNPSIEVQRGGRVGGRQSPSFATLRSGDASASGSGSRRAFHFDNSRSMSRDQRNDTLRSTSSRRHNEVDHTRNRDNVSDASLNSSHQEGPDMQLSAAQKATMYLQGGLWRMLKADVYSDEGLWE